MGYECSDKTNRNSLGLCAAVRKTALHMAAVTETSISKHKGQRSTEEPSVGIVLGPESRIGLPGIALPCSRHG